MIGPIYTDPDGDAVSVRPVEPDADAALIEMTAKALLVPAADVPEFAGSFLKALCAAVGLPEPEVVFPVGSVTMQPGEDWETLVRRAGRQHASVYPDPTEVAKAAAWAGEFDG